MLTENFDHIIESYRFRTFSNINEVRETYNIKEKMGPLSENVSVEGFLVCETLDGILLSLVSFSREFFPYQDAISIHVYIPSKQERYLSTISLLKSFVLLAKITSFSKLISRHAPENIETLFMLLSLQFRVSELSSLSRRHALVEKQFDKNLLEKLDFNSLFGIRKFYSNFSFENSELRRQKEKLSLAKEDINILKNWLGINKDSGFYGLKNIDILLQKQENIRFTRLEDRIAKIYLFQNTEINGGLILCANQFCSRRKFLKLYNILKEDKAITVYYTTASNDFINSIFFSLDIQMLV